MSHTQWKHVSWDPLSVDLRILFSNVMPTRYASQRAKLWMDLTVVIFFAWFHATKEAVLRDKHLFLDDRYIVVHLYIKWNFHTLVYEQF